MLLVKWMKGYFYIQLAEPATIFQVEKPPKVVQTGRAWKWESGNGGQGVGLLKDAVAPEAALEHAWRGTDELSLGPGHDTKAPGAGGRMLRGESQDEPELNRAA